MIRVHLEFGGECGSRVLELPFTLIREHGVADTSVATVSGITPKNFPNAQSCIAALPVTRHHAVGKPVFRIGYTNGKKQMQRGAFSGYADSHPAPWVGKPELPEGGACEEFSPYHAISRMPIGPGDCGGPVVNRETCELLALSQIGPV